MEATFRNYGNYQSDNYGAHTLCFTNPNGDRFYYSYRTLVAFETSRSGLVIRENAWGPTTGKHLNWIDPDHSKRVNKETFDKLYVETFNDQVQG